MSVKDKLLERGTDSRYAIICEDSGVATFLLYSPLTKALRGYQQYNPYSDDKSNKNKRESRYFTYQQRVQGHGDSCVFGLEQCTLDKEYLFVTEGIFESIKLHTLGCDSIAILSSDASRYLLKEIESLCSKIVWCGDNDKAGNRSNMNKIAQYRLTFEKDLDEMPDEEILKFIDNPPTNPVWWERNQQKRK